MATNEAVAPVGQCVYIALPRRPGPRPGGDGIEMTIPCRRGKIKAGLASGSLLNLNFNQLFANALNCREDAGLSHFAMQHDDILPEAGWADTLIDEMDRLNVDVMSTVIPIKDDRGLTSTGIRNWLTGEIRRLTMAEIFKLPETFTIEDIARCGIAEMGDEILVVNTGLWVCRFDDWAESFPGFRSIDQVKRQASGRFEANCLPEDWLFSEWATRKGLRIGASRKVKAGHFDGSKEYRNDHVWGDWTEDRGDTPRI